MNKKKLIEKENIQKMPKVAIIILNWNGWKDTIECLESVFRNTYPNYQVIVIDNGSTDGSMEKIKAWAEGKQAVLTPEPTHPLYHLSRPPVKKSIPYICYTREEAEKGGNFKLEEKVTKEWQEQRKSGGRELNPTSPYPLIFIQTGENLGFAGGNNVGIRYVLKKDNCKYVLLLNNDTVVEEKFLNELIKDTNRNQNVGIIGGKILYYNEPNKIWYAGGKLDLIRGSGYHKNYNRIDKNSKGRIKTSFITGCLMLINKELLNADELLFEEYFLYVEDVDFCHIIKKAGFKLCVNLNSKIYHKIKYLQKDNIKIASPDSIYYITRNRLLFMTRAQKNIIFFGLFLIFFCLSRFYKILYWLFYNKIEYITATFDGILDFLRGKYGKREINK